MPHKRFIDRFVELCGRSLRRPSFREMAGSLLMILGVVLLMNATAGAVRIAWLIGLLAIFVASRALALAMRLRQLAQGDGSRLKIAGEPTA